MDKAKAVKKRKRLSKAERMARKEERLRNASMDATVAEMDAVKQLVQSKDVGSPCNRYSSQDMLNRYFIVRQAGTTWNVKALSAQPRRVRAATPKREQTRY